jgi:glutamine amidotransferase
VTPITVTMIDYGAGNPASIIKGFEAAGAAVRLAAQPGDLAGASAIVVPGVGNFEATRSLDEPWRQAVVDATRHGVALLGICLGMQWLFQGSAEVPDLPGLGLFEGRCSRLPDLEKVPHVGWNTLEILAEHARLLDGIEPGAYAYFTHSFAAPVVDGVVAATTHGERFASVIERRRVCGVQFHPEKSGRTGLQVLRNFLTIARGG